MIHSGRDRDGISRTDIANFVPHLHSGNALQNVVNFFSFYVMVALRATAGGKSGLGQRLVADTRIPVREEFADLGAILCYEGWNFVEIFYVHDASSSLVAGPAGILTSFQEHLAGRDTHLAPNGVPGFMIVNR